MRALILVLLKLPTSCPYQVVEEEGWTHLWAQTVLSTHFQGANTAAHLSSSYICSERTEMKGSHSKEAPNLYPGLCRPNLKGGLGTQHHHTSNSDTMTTRSCVVPERGHHLGVGKGQSPGPHAPPHPSPALPAQLLSSSTEQALSSLTPSPKPVRQVLWSVNLLPCFLWRWCVIDPVTQFTSYLSDLFP